MDDVRTMDDVVERSTAQRWLNMVLVTAFAVIALILASVGVFGVMSYSVARQTRELYGVKPGDPISFAVAAATFVAVAMLASYLPARRAAAVDPVIALRTE